MHFQHEGSALVMQSTSNPAGTPGHTSTIISRNPYLAEHTFRLLLGESTFAFVDQTALYSLQYQIPLTPRHLSALATIGVSVTDPTSNAEHPKARLSCRIFSSEPRILASSLILWVPVQNWEGLHLHKGHNLAEDIWLMLS